MSCEKQFGQTKPLWTEERYTFEYLPSNCEYWIEGTLCYLWVCAHLPLWGIVKSLPSSLILFRFLPFSLLFFTFKLYNSSAIVKPSYLWVTPLKVLLLFIVTPSGLCSLTFAPVSLLWNTFPQRTWPSGFSLEVTSSTKLLLIYRICWVPRRIWYLLQSQRRDVGNESLF